MLQCIYDATYVFCFSAQRGCRINMPFPFHTDLNAQNLWIYMRSPETQEPPFTVLFFFFLLQCGFTVPSICIILLEALYILTVFTDPGVISRPVNPFSPLKCILKANSISGRQTLFLHVLSQSPWTQEGERGKENKNALASSKIHHLKGPDWVESALMPLQLTQLVKVEQQQPKENSKVGRISECM